MNPNGCWRIVWSRCAFFHEKPLPRWGADLSELDLNDIIYYARADAQETDNWQEVPEEIRRVYDRLGIPEAERKMLAGVGAQYESEVVYHNLKKEWEELGVIFLDMDDALRLHPELVRQYFMKCVPASDHKFAALHGAVWSGGTFLYVPKGVHIRDPLQAYFRMNAKIWVSSSTRSSWSRRERMRITSKAVPLRNTVPRRSMPGLWRLFVKPGATCRYSSVENWSRDTYNLNTKRAVVEKDATMEWVGGNMGSGVAMLYPCSMLMGEGARCDHLAIAFANKDQWQDTGAKIFHMAPHTSSKVTSKSISKSGGTAIYRGMLHVAPSARDSTANIQCDALLLDEISPDGHHSRHQDPE